MSELKVSQTGRWTAQQARAVLAEIDRRGIIARAGRVARIGGRTRLRLTQNPGAQQLYQRLERGLFRGFGPAR